MLVYGIKNPKDGLYYHVFPYKYLTEMCAGKDDKVEQFELELDSDGPYWGWHDNSQKEGEFCMIYPHRILFEMCFPYGVRAEIDAGIGYIARFKVKEKNNAVI